MAPYGACEVAQSKVRSHVVLSKERNVLSMLFRAHGWFEGSVNVFSERTVNSKAWSMDLSSAQSIRRHWRVNFRAPGGSSSRLVNSKARSIAFSSAQSI